MNYKIILSRIFWFSFIIFIEFLFFGFLLSKFFSFVFPNLNNTVRIIITITITLAYPIYNVIIVITNTKFITKKIKNESEIIRNLLNSVNENKYSLQNQTAKKISDFIVLNSGMNLTQNFLINYYQNGEDFFFKIINELKKAKHFIFIEFFIIENGIFWKTILKILLEKVKKGVEVRIIYDDFGSCYLPYNFDKKLGKLGIKVLVLQKFIPLLQPKINNRDHRKIIIVDGKTCFTGGFNIADEYINKKQRLGLGVWKDNAIKVSGEAVDNLTALFLIQWIKFFDKQKLNSINFSQPEYSSFFKQNKTLLKEKKENNEGFIQLYGDWYCDGKNISANVYIQLINAAKKYIYITTPYLIPTKDISNALVNATKRGVKVMIITPRSSDKKFILKLSRTYYCFLIENNIEIYEFKPGFMHMKTFIVDDDFVITGSTNLDCRSLYLSDENNIFMYKTSCIQKIKDDFISCLEKSEKIEKNKFSTFCSLKLIATTF